MAGKAIRSAGRAECTVAAVSDLPETYEERRLSFGRDADTYAAHRPTYPVEAVRWMLAGRAAQRVVDIGAGTGALTALLVAEGHDVVAVEPDPGMLGALQARLPAVESHLGPAEALPLVDDSVDAVLAAQAWHWFDPQLAPAEFARVLRTGGTVGLVWNIRDDEHGWMADLHEIVGGEDSIRARRGPDFLADVLGERFAPLETAHFSNPVRHTPDSLVGLVSTFSYVRTRPDAEQVYARVRELTETHPDLVGRDSFDLVYVTATYRATLR
jgi:SAM-dependent methyltransferase